MSEIVFKPQKISQPNAKKELSTADASAFKKCSYKGGWYPKKYRQWTDIKNLLVGKKAQCGSTEGSKYGGEIQHIGSPTGDFPQPALLHFYDFDTSKLQSSNKINKLTISFSYRVINVTASGKLWVKNLAKNERAVIQGVSAWFGTSDKKKLFSAVQKKDTKIRYEFKDKNNKYIWKTISFTFKDISVSDILNKDFAFNLQFGYNCSSASTPCILYLSGVKMNVDYEEGVPYIEGKNSINHLYTSAETVCQSSIIQTIEAGYKNGKTKINVNKAPKKLGSTIKVKKAPTGVTVTSQTSDDLKTTFQITDKSNIPGEKTITYYLNDFPSKTVNVSYTAIKREKPEYNFITKYKHNEDFDSNKAYVIFKNGCATSIKIYIDSLDSSPIKLSITNQNSETNLLNEQQIKKFHNAIKTLKCGYHVLYIQRGNESLEDVKHNDVTIQVSPMNYKFRIYSDTNPNLIYQQSKDSASRKESINIQRIDNEPIEKINNIKIFDETNLDQVPHSVNNVAKGQIITHEIDKYYAGDFYIKVMDDTNNCSSTNSSIGKITIKSNHRQNYDYLFTRGEDGTAFDFDYLVAWEGDRILAPITVTDINLTSSNQNIKICSQSSETGLSQIGIVNLRVRNITEDQIINNLKLELNTLELNDNDQLDVTTDEWTTPDGIFNDFYKLFHEFNENLGNNVEVKNLTADNDLIDEENVYLLIQQIDPSTTINIKIPYRCSIEKEIHLQYLLFEEAQPIHNISSCDNNIRETNLPTDISINVIDSMQTELEITGNTDILFLDDTFDCPQECYTTKDDNGDLQSGGITYRITNIDTNNFENTPFISTQIINSNELIPYGYYVNGEYYALFDANGNKKTNIRDNPMRDEQGEIIYDPNTSQPIYQLNKIQWTQEEKIGNPQPLSQQLIYCYIKFPKQQKETIIQRTNTNGLANFFITIPYTLNNNYTIEELLDSVVYFKYMGNTFYDQSVCKLNNNFEQITRNTEKNETILSYTDNHKKYYPGEVVHIPISLAMRPKLITNQITFNANLQDIGSSDEVTILYKICNLNDNEGKFKTTFKTNNKFLIPHEITENIYCGIDSKIQVDTRIEKSILESETINMIYINAINQDKINKDVSIEIDLGQRLDINYLGDYSFLDINIDDGDYAISEEDGRIIVTWLIGRMDEFQKNKGIIKIKAGHVGLSDIQIHIFDYIHQKGKDDLIIKNSKCNKCENKPTTYRVKDSPWKQFNGIWYKLINGKYYKKVINNGKIKWVAK